MISFGLMGNMRSYIQPLDNNTDIHLETQKAVYCIVVNEEKLNKLYKEIHQTTKSGHGAMMGEWVDFVFLQSFSNAHDP